MTMISSPITQTKPTMTDVYKRQVFIQVDRNGTKAAAITWGGMNDKAAIEARSVILDRPFVYAIVDNATGLPIFIGAVTAL